MGVCEAQLQDHFIKKNKAASFMRWALGAAVVCFLGGCHPSNAFLDSDAAEVGSAILADRRLDSRVAEVEGYSFKQAGCVAGHNIQVLDKQTLDECRILCDASPKCIAFAFVAAKAANATDKVGRCQLKDVSTASDEGNASLCEELGLFTKQYARELAAAGMYEYKHLPRSCVNGHNVKTLSGQSVAACRSECDKIPNCLAFEFGVAYGGGGARKPGDCILQDHTDSSSCDGSYHNLDLYLKPYLQGYTYIPRTCVSGHNIETLSGRSLDDCRSQCDRHPKCVGFEFGVAYGGGGARRAGDCVLQDHTDYYGCDGSYHNTDLHLKHYSTDLLTLTRVQCVSPAHGIDGILLDLFGAARKLIDFDYASPLDYFQLYYDTLTVVVDGVAKGLDPMDVATALKGALLHDDWAVKLLEIYDHVLSGQDDLILKVDGFQVIRQQISTGQSLSQNIQRSFKGFAQISVIEEDYGSDNDDLGHVYAVGGLSKENRRVIIVAPSDDEGSLYEVDYKVQAGAGVESSLVKYMICGTNQCNSCDRYACDDQVGSYPGLDRDGDKGDLKSCPLGFTTLKYHKYPQFIVEDVYLRICERVDN